MQRHMRKHPNLTMHRQQFPQNFFDEKVKSKKKNLNFRLTPILNIVQTFMNEPTLMDAIVDLPEERSFIGTVTTIYTHKKFKYLQENISILKTRLPTFMNLVGSSFNIKKLWSGNEISLPKRLYENIKLNAYFQITKHFPRLVE